MSLCLQFDLLPLKPDVSQTSIKHILATHCHVEEVDVFYYLFLKYKLLEAKGTNNEINSSPIEGFLQNSK